MISEGHSSIGVWLYTPRQIFGHIDLIAGRYKRQSEAAKTPGKRR